MANVSLLSSGLPAPQKGLSKARKTAEKALVYKLLKSINKIPTSYKDYLFRKPRAQKKKLWEIFKQIDKMKTRSKKVYYEKEWKTTAEIKKKQQNFENACEHWQVNKKCYTKKLLPH